MAEEVTETLADAVNETPEQTLDERDGTPTVPTDPNPQQYEDEDAALERIIGAAEGDEGAEADEPQTDEGEETSERDEPYEAAVRALKRYKAPQAVIDGMERDEVVAWADSVKEDQKRQDQMGNEVAAIRRELQEQNSAKADGKSEPAESDPLSELLSRAKDSMAVTTRLSRRSSTCSHSATITRAICSTWRMPTNSGSWPVLVMYWLTTGRISRTSSHSKTSPNASMH